GPHDEAVRARADEDNVLTIDLLNRVRGHGQRRRRLSDRDLSIRQHFGPKTLTRVVQSDADLHHAQSRIEFLTEIRDRAGEPLVAKPWKGDAGGLSNTQLAKTLLTDGGEHPDLRQIPDHERILSGCDRSTGRDVLLEHVA